VWYGMGDFTSVMRRQLAALTVDQVNAAVRRHLTARDISVVIVTKDAAGLKQGIVSESPSPIRDHGEEPPKPLAQDRLVGSRNLNVAAEHVTITPIVYVFAK